MPTTKETRIFSSREFTRDVSAAKRQTSDGPVFITDRGQVAYVLLSVGEYNRLTQGDKNIVEQLLDNQVRKAFADLILPVDEAIAIRCAQFHVPDKRPKRDALIAATAIEHSMTMVTRNVADFMDLTTTLLNPWEFKA